MNKILIIPLLFMLALPTLTPTPVTATPPTYPYTLDDPVITKAQHYLASRQTSDGSIAGLTTSAWAAMAYAAANHTDASLTTYLINSIQRLDTTTATDWERHALALVACGQDPTNVAGTNLPIFIEGFSDGTQLGDPSLIYDDIFGVIALTACGVPSKSSIIIQEKMYILSHQRVDGGWGDADSTAAAIMALTAAGEDTHDTAIIPALAYLKTTQTSTGGFQSWGSTNAASTAWVTCAIVAAGQDPTSEQWKKNGCSPIDYLTEMQQPDGSFNWSDGQDQNPEWMTSYVLCALLARPYPVVVWQPPEDHEPPVQPMDEWMGNVRVEGKTATLFNGTVTCSNITVQAYNQSSGHNELYYLPNPTVLTALVTALDSEHISYSIIFYPDWNAFYVKTINGESDWWQYFVDYRIPMVDAGHYLLTENESRVLFGYLENWITHALRISLDKHTINVSEELIIHAFNESMAPAKNVTIWIGTSQFTTDDSGIALIQCENPGDFQVYAEGSGYIRSEKTRLLVTKSLTITRPANNTIYLWNKPLNIPHYGILIIGALDVEVNAVAAIDKVEFYVDGNLYNTDLTRPFSWKINLRSFTKQVTITVLGYDSENGKSSRLYDQDEVHVRLVNWLPRLHGSVTG
jgi:hypothetical protein